MPHGVCRPLTSICTVTPLLAGTATSMAVKPIEIAIGRREFGQYHIIWHTTTDWHRDRSRYNKHGDLTCSPEWAKFRITKLWVRTILLGHTMTSITVLSGLCRQSSNTANVYSKRYSFDMFIRSSSFGIEVDPFVAKSRTSR